MSLDDVLWSGIAALLLTTGVALAVATALPAPWPQVAGVSSAVALLLFAEHLPRIIRRASLHLSLRRLRSAGRRRPAFTDRIPHEHR